MQRYERLKIVFGCLSCNKLCFFFTELFVFVVWTQFCLSLPKHDVVSCVWECVRACVCASMFQWVYGYICLLVIWFGLVLFRSSVLKSFKFARNICTLVCECVTKAGVCGRRCLLYVCGGVRVYLCSKFVRFCISHLKPELNSLKGGQRERGIYREING